MDDDPFGPSAEPPTHLTPEILDEDPFELIGSWVSADPDGAERQLVIDGQLALIGELADQQVWELVQEMLACIRQRNDDLANVIARRAFDDGRAYEAGGVRDAGAALSAAHLLDPQVLRSAIDDVLDGDTELRDLQRRVVRAQERLRWRVDPTSWRLMLAWEELMTCTSVVAQERLVTWAYRSGYRRRGPSSPESADHSASVSER